MTDKEIFHTLHSAGLTVEGACGLMGNMKAESGMKANIAQRGMTTKTDDEYTAAADNGTIDFVNDGVGYGYIQLTYYTRKAKYLAYCKQLGKSVGDAKTQIDFIILELTTDYPMIMLTLRTSHDMYECTKQVCEKYENPAEWNTDARYQYAQQFYNAFVHGQSTQTIQTPAFDPNIAKNMLLKLGDKGDEVEAMQKRLIELGYDVGVDGADGDFGINTLNALKAYQQANNLPECGYFGPKTFESMKTKQDEKTSVEAKSASKYAPGDFVSFVGNKQYSSPYFDFSRDAKPGKARVATVKVKAKHPYCLLSATNGGSNVNGWVNAEDVKDL